MAVNKLNKLLTERKGVLGFETALDVVKILLVAGVVVIAVFLALSVLYPIIDTTDTKSGTVANEIGYVNNTGYTLGQATLVGFSNPTITQITNRTDGTVLLSGNYSLTGNVLKNASTAQYHNASISYTYNYDGDAAIGANNVNNNITTGTVKFFSYIPTIFTILAVVVIVLAIALILYAVNKFAGRKTDIGL